MPVTVWKGQLTFGLVSIPIRIIRAARQERVRFAQVYRAQVHDDEKSSEDQDYEEPAPAPPGRKVEARATPPNAARLAPVEQPQRVSAEEPPHVERVQRQYTAADTGAPVEPHDLLKGYEYKKGQFAVFRPEEIRRFRAEATRDMEILEFVKLETVDPVFQRLILRCSGSRWRKTVFAAFRSHAQIGFCGSGAICHAWPGTDTRAPSRKTRRHHAHAVLRGRNPWRRRVCG